MIYRRGGSVLDVPRSVDGKGREVAQAELKCLGLEKLLDTRNACTDAVQNGKLNTCILQYMAVTDDKNRRPPKEKCMLNPLLFLPDNVILQLLV